MSLIIGDRENRWPILAYLREEKTGFQSPEDRVPTAFSPSE